ncbi:hypothetical protein HPP92_008442 [Vanilla planifolia]|uniref:Uncharacterized protein n=1 Tax=Vanilla planifolia TaxID=51239 RepID=A0A835R646_VANPL|nr:hypothetical protein HPP92_008442 [Vanilla planifolia]
MAPIADCMTEETLNGKKKPRKIKGLRIIAIFVVVENKTSALAIFQGFGNATSPNIIRLYLSKQRLYLMK